MFFVALTQSSIGTGAAYVALLVVAYDRLDSAWAVSLVLLAEFVPAMFFGPLLGAVVDRSSRRACLVLADLVRAVAFVGIAVVPSFELTLLLALVAGFGTALFKPAALASLPSLVDPRRSSAATSLFGALNDAGYTVGPAAAALVLLAVGPEELLIVNGITFLLSAVILARLSFGEAVRGEGERSMRALLRDAREGVRATARMPAIRVVLFASATAMLLGGLVNVAELPFAEEDLGAGPAGYSALVAVYGVGFVVGSLLGVGGGEPRQLKRRYIIGLGVMGASGVLAASLPVLGVALAAFAMAGLGNGMFVVYERLLFQAEVAEGLQGRVFALSEALVAWGFAIAYLVAGAVTTLLGPQLTIAATGAGEVLLAACVVLALRKQWTGGEGRLAQPAEAY